MGLGKDSNGGGGGGGGGRGRSTEGYTETMGTLCWESNLRLWEVEGT